MKQQLTTAFICLECRKVFKRPSHRRVGNHYKELNYTPACPQCRSSLIKVGDTFRAPQKDDLAAWQRVGRDIAKGRTFVRDEAFERRPTSRTRRNNPKGIRSVFQLPARKRRNKKT
jgi:hypothetical protein